MVQTTVPILLTSFGAHIRTSGWRPTVLSERKPELNQKQCRICQSTKHLFLNCPTRFAMSVMHTMFGIKIPLIFYMVQFHCYTSQTRGFI